ncbi:MAG TPA: ferredoxin [Acidimicrobiales bacterium]|nr:ferredoxin [Acidimicrobiales bacterium]
MSDPPASERASKAAPVRIRLDPTRCAGHGICALISGERIGLDGWGFAVVDPTEIGEANLRRRARRAVAACPRGALSLEEVPGPSRTGAAWR